MSEVRLIDANELLKKVDAIPPRNGDLEKYCDTDTAWLVGITDVMSYIESAPTVDAEPIKHGRWEICVTDFFGGEDVKCSVCGEFENLPSWNYCPHCGAKMDGAE